MRWVAVVWALTVAWGLWSILLLVLVDRAARTAWSAFFYAGALTLMAGLLVGFFVWVVPLR